MLATQDLQVVSATNPTGEELADDLIRMRHEIDVMELGFAMKAAAFAATDYYDRAGSVSPIDWIRFNCHMTSNSAAERVAVGERMGAMPESFQALADGRIGFAHLSVMARTANAVGSKFNESALIVKALENSPGKFHHICKHYRHAADRAGFEAEQAELVENRRLWISTCEDGAVVISGVFDPEGGAAIRTALEPLARKSGARDDRTREKRMADAAVELAIHSLDSGLIPQLASQRTHLQVTTSLETLMGMAGAPAADMELSFPISSKTVERLACDASIMRILLDSESMVIDVGRAKRTIKGPARKALNVRDEHCVWTGCERPASWCSGHHLVHWLHGGTNESFNLALLCHRHHWMVHEGNWQIIRSDDGKILTIPPTVAFAHPARGPD